MVEELKLSDWIAVLMGCAGVIAAFVVFLWQKRDARKSLTYDFTSARITYMHKDFTKGLKITFNNAEVQDATLVSLTVRNAGDVPILKSDFDEELRFAVPPEQQILAVQVSEAKPLGLGAEANIAKEKIVVRPLLLNKGDQFTIMALINGAGKEIKSEGRIVGVQDIKMRQIEGKDAIGPVMRYMAVSCVLLVTANISGWQVRAQHPLLGYYVIDTAVSAFAIITMIVGYIGFRRTR